MSFINTKCTGVDYVLYSSEKYGKVFIIDGTLESLEERCYRCILEHVDLYCGVTDDNSVDKLEATGKITGIFKNLPFQFRLQIFTRLCEQGNLTFKYFCNLVDQRDNLTEVKFPVQVHRRQIHTDTWQCALLLIIRSPQLTSVHLSKSKTSGESFSQVQSFFAEQPLVYKYTFKSLLTKLLCSLPLKTLVIDRDVARVDGSDLDTIGTVGNNLQTFICHMMRTLKVEDICPLIPDHSNSSGCPEMRHLEIKNSCHAFLKSDALVALLYGLPKLQVLRDSRVYPELTTNDKDDICLPGRGNSTEGRMIQRRPGELMLASLFIMIHQKQEFSTDSFAKRLGSLKYLQALQIYVSSFPRGDVCLLHHCIHICGHQLVEFSLQGSRNIQFVGVLQAIQKYCTSLKLLILSDGILSACESHPIYRDTEDEDSKSKESSLQSLASLQTLAISSCQIDASSSTNMVALLTSPKLQKVTLSENNDIEPFLLRAMASDPDAFSEMEEMIFVNKKLLAFNNSWVKQLIRRCNKLYTLTYCCRAEMKAVQGELEEIREVIAEELLSVKFKYLMYK